MTEVFDITVIGGGPVGLFTAFYAHLRKAKVKIIDSLPQLGGQPAILYPEKTILDIPAFPHLTGQELTNQLLAQLAPFDTKVCLNETVIGIKKGEYFTITTSKEQHISKTIIIAMGGGAFKPRLLDIEGIENFHNIHYHVSNLKQYANQRVVVLGGGDSAVDWALAFHEQGCDTHIIHRREQFRAMEHSVERLLASDIMIHTPYLPKAIQGQGGLATDIECQQVKSKESLTVSFDHLFVNYGFKSSVGRLKEWGLELQRNRILVNRKHETSIQGIYAVGDCCAYDGKIDLIATGLGEAPVAVNHAMHFMNPAERVQPKHSSSL